MPASIFRVGIACLFCAFLSGCIPEAMKKQQEKEESAKPTLESLVDTVAEADYVILGENHDNPIHHDLQLATLEALHARGWLKLLALEMLTPSQQVSADKLISDGITDLGQIYKELNWDDGWDWALYGPIVIWAVAEGIPLKAANLDTEELKAIREQHLRADNMVLDSESLQLHRDRFVSAHCGYINKAVEEKMLRVQVARDARMAASLTSEKTGVALLAGNWHARKDIGVPRYVLSSHPEARLMSVGFLEYPDMAHFKSPYFYDVAWDTPGMQRPDYCEMMKKHKK